MKRGSSGEERREEGESRGKKGEGKEEGLNEEYS